MSDQFNLLNLDLRNQYLARYLSRLEHLIDHVLEVRVDSTKAEVRASLGVSSTDEADETYLHQENNLSDLNDSDAAFDAIKRQATASLAGVVQTGTDPSDVPTIDDANSLGFAEQVDSISALRSTSFPASLQRIWLKGYYSDSPGVGGGELFRSGGSDNGGTRIADGDGVIWERKSKPIHDVYDFGAKGDDSTGDRQAFANADSVGSFKVTAGDFVIESDLTINNAVYIDSRATIKPDASVTVSVSAPYHPPVAGSGIGGDGEVRLEQVVVNVPADYATIQEAVDNCPKNLSQYYVVELDDGTYNEDIILAGIISQDVARWSTGLENARFSIRGKAGTPKNPNVRVRSIYSVGCIGNAVPSITNLTVFDSTPYTDEGEACGFYGCYGATVSRTSFDGNGVRKCIVSYSSNVEGSGNDFGAGVNDHAYTVKHEGFIGVIPDSGDDTGQLNVSAYWPQSGQIEARNAGNLTSDEPLVRQKDASSTGTVSDIETGRFWGPTIQAETRKGEIATEFESLDSWRDTSAGGSVSVNEFAGLRLSTGGTSENIAGTSLVRARSRLDHRNWRNRTFRATFTLNQITNQVAYILTGEKGSTCIGAKVVDDVLYGVVNDGTSETTVELENPTDTNNKLFMAQSFGSFVEFYLSASLVGKITSGVPSGTAPNDIFSIEIETSENADKILDGADMYIAQ